MTTCPACGERAFSIWRKQLITFGRLHACEKCGAALGVSSSIAISWGIVMTCLVVAGSFRSSWGAFDWELVAVAAVIVIAAPSVAPLWHVTAVSSWGDERDHRAKAGRDGTVAPR